MLASAPGFPGLWKFRLSRALPCSLSRLGDDALVVARLDVVDGAEEVALRVLEGLGVAVGVRRG